jgi:Mg-chelatase subunit ChlD
MRKFTLTVILLLLVTAISFAQITENISDSNSLKKPKMQVVFALDATASMSGLISAAKDKIWSIINSLTQTQTTPDIQVGLIFYRDRGDAFITKRIPLTDSMDMVYSELMQIRAQGGGDGPESVNQGLNEAVELFNWDKDTSTYKVIFLVGDCEPHMDYKDDIPYYVTCKTAKSKDIVLNTILMGTNKVAEKIWKEIALCNEGAYVNVNMSANDLAINTPYDSIISGISDRLDDMRYYYGRADEKSSGFNFTANAKKVTKVAATNVKAQRAEYNAYYFKKSAYRKQNELLSDVASGNVKLDTLNRSELPDEFKNVSADSLPIVVKQRSAQRDSLQKELAINVAKRNAYIETELSKKNAAEVKSSFNNVIFEKIQLQTKKKNITLKGKAKY